MSAADVSKLPGTAFRFLVNTLEDKGCQQSRDKKSWTCPAHADAHPSLSISQGEKGAVIYCRAGCDTQAVVDALGIKMADLFDGSLSRDRSAPQKHVAKPNGSASSVPSKRVAVYDYENAAGDLLGRKVRLEPGIDGREKSFLWEKADGGKGDGSGNPGILYALPLVAEAEVVHVCEGEKAADSLNAYFATHGQSDHAATCAPTPRWEPSYTDTLRKKRVVLWADRDPAGANWAQTIYTELVEADIPVEAVQARVPTAKADAFDHLEAGFSPDNGEPLALQLDAEQRERADFADRFSEARTRIEFIFDTAPKPREFLVSDFLPAHESGLLIARGGTGKGFLQITLTLSLALGESFGPFDVLKQRGTVLVSVEDDREEFHRRITAALDLRYSDESHNWRRELREELTKHIRYVDLRGITKPHLGTELRDRIARTVDRVADPGLVLLDPLGRFAPEGTQINSQEGAALVINELDAIRQITGASVLAAYHVTKAAVRDGGELRSGASSGSLQLEDLSRWVLNLKGLTSKEAADYGLDTQGYHYVESAITKTNYSPLLSSPLVWRRCAGGALVWAKKARNAAEIDEDHAMTVLLKAGYWMTRDAWEEQVKELYDTGINRTRDARTRMVNAGRVIRHEVRESREHRCVFAPAESIRRTTWPEPPEKLAEIRGLKKGETDAQQATIRGTA